MFLECIMQNVKDLEMSYLCDCELKVRYIGIPYVVLAEPRPQRSYTVSVKSATLPSRRVDTGKFLLVSGDDTDLRKQRTGLKHRSRLCHLES